jgi:hypothetical protein
MIARWLVFKPQIWVNLEGLEIRKCLYFYHLEYFMEIWDILWPFGTF